MLPFPPWNVSKITCTSNFTLTNPDDYLKKNESQVDQIQQTLWIANMDHKSLELFLGRLQPCDRSIFLSRVPLVFLIQLCKQAPETFWCYTQCINRSMIQKWKEWDHSILHERLANNQSSDYEIQNVSCMVNLEWNFHRVRLTRNSMFVQVLQECCRNLSCEKKYLFVVGDPECIFLAKKRPTVVFPHCSIYLIGDSCENPIDTRSIIETEVKTFDQQIKVYIHLMPYSSIQHFLWSQQYSLCLDLFNQTFWSTQSFLMDFKVKPFVTKQLVFSKKKLRLHASRNIPVTNLSHCYHCSAYFHAEAKPGFMHKWFYESFCFSCSMEHLVRRLTPLTCLSAHEKKFALVTGGRIKIGYATCLELLRRGYHVITTSRFPIHAMARYQQEEDYDSFVGRLSLYQVDFRQLNRVEEFILFLQSHLPSLHILINNAAQTFTYDEDYYRQFLEYETEEKKVCLPHIKEEQNLSLCAHEYDFHLPSFPVDRFGELITQGGKFWHQRAHEVSTEDLLTMQLVNYIVPSLFTIRLKSLMEQTNGNKFIVQVTCREGNFSLPNKDIYHFHSNAAKSSLNMLTRTISEDYKKSNIYVNSVDPGFVSFALNTNQICPIDCIEASLRILDPVFQNPPQCGLLWKNYRSIAW
jgi:NAD(P)-dependent dehydrogenase (short-subunit alcohol dehydrogenase family)